MFMLDQADSWCISEPAEVYVYDIASITAGLVTISSDDSLLLFDPLTLGNGPVSSIKNVNTDISCLKAFHTGTEGGPVIACTAGRDGKVCILDPRLGSKVAEVQTDQNTPILSIAQSSTFNLAAGTELSSYQATVTIWDIRNFSKPLRQYVESHSDDVTELQFHPSLPHVLLSGSTDGLVNIYDTNVLEEEDALYQTINHGSSIHHAGFLSNTDIFALSHDEKFSMYELANGAEDSTELHPSINYGDMREVLGGEYIVNVFPRPVGGSIIGVGSHSRESFGLIQLINEPSWSFVLASKVDLAGAHGSDIVRSFCLEDSVRDITSIKTKSLIKCYSSERYTPRVKMVVSKLGELIERGEMWLSTEE